MTAPKKLPAHGTVARYRKELAAGKACDKCKAANSKARAGYRASKKSPSTRPNLTIVPDTQKPVTAHTPRTRKAVTDSTPSADDETPPPPPPGTMQLAVVDDLKSIQTDEQVPFHKTLSALALQLSKEIDSAESATARSGASRQLFEVLKSLRTTKEGDGGSALDTALGDIGLPLLPDGPPAVWHPSKSG